MAKRKTTNVPPIVDKPGAVSCAEFVFGWPPSLNHCWGASGKGRFLTAAYKQFLKDAALVVAGTVLKNSDAYFVEIMATPPDNRTRDLDNIIKPTLDTLTRCGVWPDDKLVVKLNAIKCKPNHAACVRVLVGVLGAYSLPENKRRPDNLVDEFFANFRDALKVKSPDEFDPKIRALAYYYRELLPEQN